MRKIIISIALLLLTSCANETPVVKDPIGEGQDLPVLEETDLSEDKDKDKDKDKENNSPGEEVKEVTDEDIIASIDMSLEPNELGEIMILMYHGIGPEESEWQRTPENFRKDLEYMYQNGYQMISLNDYAKGEIKTEAGFTPIILTFDDGRQNNFNLMEEDGGIIIDPDCAIGILEEFKSKYPDFDVTASFFLGTNPFGQKEHADYKLNWLIENGYDLGNHTYSHNEMAKQDAQEIQIEIGSINKILKEYLPEYTVETIALPHGSNPRDEFIEVAHRGEYEGLEYEMIAILDVGWRPAYSPFDTLTNFSSLYRVTASEINVDNCGINDYFKQYEENRRERFISDGNPDVVTIPQRHIDYLNMDIVGDRLVNVYE